MQILEERADVGVSAKAPVTPKKVRRLKGFLITPYLFLLPALVPLAFWVYKPLFQTVGLSFYKWSMVPGTEPIFVGIHNFSHLFSNEQFLPAFLNTLIYIVGMLPFSIILPLLIAVWTNDLKGHVKQVYRTLFFLPMVMAPVATSVIFQWLLNPGNGLINAVLLRTHITSQQIAFLNDPHFARLAIILISGWKMIGFSVLLFSAALSAIDSQYIEAAQLDGASRFRRFWDFTLPFLSPTIMFVLTLSVLFTSQSTYAYIDVLTQGGPFSTTTNAYYLMYQFGFSNMNVGLGAAAGIIFMVIFGVIAIVLQALSKRLSFYDN